MREKHEAELIAASKRGDQAAIGELFERHYASSLGVARGILHSVEESEDAVQSAYLAAFRHLHTFRGDASFKTWIGRIVMNECLMRLRQSWFRIHRVNLDALAANGRSALLASPAPTPEKLAFCREIASALSSATASLPKHLGETFQLYAVSGLTVSQVAEATGLTLSSAKSRLFRAQGRMRKHLQPVWSNRRVPGPAAPGVKPGQPLCELRSKAA